MYYSLQKKPPIRISLNEENYNFLIEALKANENDFEGYIAESAKSLREKIEKYGRHETSEDGGEVVRLCFFENEGEKFIWQFLATSKIAADYRELSEIADKYRIE